jgi:hypothetical protein
MRSFSAREKRLAIYLVIFLSVIGWDRLRRRWTPNLTIPTEHYLIQSTATADHTKNVGQVAEIIHTEYITFLDQLGITAKPHSPLKMKLYHDRDEFRFCNRIRGWAEAFYRAPYCHQYYPTHEANPYHWMVHEATHQLNNEVAGFALSKWLEEGISEYFGTSQIASNRLELGTIDTNTYPIWWISQLAVSGSLEDDKVNGSVIPLRSIISGAGGPKMNDEFNLYYLHWWSLVHFLFQHESGKYITGISELVTSKGDVASFETYIGNIEAIEQEWYTHVQALKLELACAGTRPVRLE